MIFRDLPLHRRSEGFIRQTVSVSTLNILFPFGPIMRELDYSTPRVSRHRRHSEGDHSQCEYRSCHERTMLENELDLAIRYRCTFDLLAERGIDPARYYGDQLPAIQEQASREFPDYLDQKPDAVHRLQAKCDVDDWELWQGQRPALQW